MAGKPGEYESQYQARLDEILDQILNREKFSYDLNGDALYQQYKDQYMLQGQQAMMDTMGQASAMTGGYGNSYAATVGNQTYQGYLQGLNDIVPELYRMALDRYNSEGERLAQNYSVLSADRDTERGEYNDETSRLAANFDVLSSDRNAEYGLWSDKRNQLVTDRGYYSDAYNNAYTQDYTAWNDNRTYDTSQYWNEYNAGYQKDRDAIADAQWQKEYNLAVSKANSGSSGGSTKTPSIPDYVLEKAATFTDDDSLAVYLDDLTTAGAITEAQSDALYANFKGTPQKSLADRTWEVTDDGGWNWFNGVDNNAVLQDQYDNSYTAKDLKKALINDGMSEKDANDFLKKYGVYK
jgi:hypothetical protein